MAPLELPEGWKQIKIGDKNYFQLIMGHSPPSNTYTSANNGMPFFQGKAEFGDSYPIAIKYCSAPKRIAKKGDVLISVRAPVGPTNIADRECCIGRGLAAIRCHDNKIDPIFLLYSLRNIEAYIALSVQQQGGGFTTIRKEQLEDIEIIIPSFDEQKKIATRIEQQTYRILKIKSLFYDLVKDFNDMLLGVYTGITKNAKYQPMSEVAPLVRRSVKVELLRKYPELGIRSFGKGTFHKLALTGAELGSKRIFRIEEGDLLFNIVFAWEGAIAVAKLEDHGRVGSHRFLTCVPKKEVATSPFLCFHFLTERGLHDLGDASPGGAGRNRTLGLKALDKIRVPVPPYEKQVWFSALWEKMRKAKQLQKEISEELAAYTPALLSKAFRGEL